MTAISDLKEAVAEDPVYQGLKQAVETVQHSIDPKKILGEAKSLHETRKSRKLSTTAMSSMPLYEARMDELKCRARLTTLRVAVIIEIRALETLQSKVKKHLHVKYAEYLAAWSNQSMRNQVVDRIIAKSEEVLEDIKAVEEVLKYYIEDIDQAAFAIKGGEDTFKLFTERRDQMV